MASSSSYSSAGSPPVQSGSPPVRSGSPPVRSGSPPVQAGSEDHRKRKRMESNRESARRSRMRKQQHLDELAAQAARLVKENGQIAASLNLTRQNCLSVESENSVLRAQMMELSQRLDSLNEILSYINSAAADSGPIHNIVQYAAPEEFEGFLNTDPWNLAGCQQPVMASSVEMFGYY